MVAFQLTVLQKWLDQEVRNVFYVKSDTSDGSDLIGPADTIWDAYTVLAASLVNDWSMYRIDGRRVDLPGYPSIVVWAPGTVTGGSAVDSVATQIAGVVTFRSFTPRPNKSIKFIAGLPETAIVDSRLTAAYKSTLEAWATSIRNGILAVAGDWELVAARWDVDNTYVEATNAIAVRIVSDIPGTQRRRKIGRGI